MIIIKVNYHLSVGSLFGSHDQILRGEFNSVQNAVDHLMNKMGLVLNQMGKFEAHGVYVAKDGQYNKPSYQIVNKKSGKCSKALLNEIEEAVERNLA